MSSRFCLQVHRLAVASITILAATLVSACYDETQDQPEKSQQEYLNEGWQPLFNGKNLDGWIIKFRGHEVGHNLRDTFRVENGMLIADYRKWKNFDGNPYGHTYTEASYSDYRIRVEYRFVGDHVKVAPELDWAFRNNGVMLHSQSPYTVGLDQRWPMSGEAQLLGGELPPQSASLKEKFLEFFGYAGRTTANLCSNSTNIRRNGVLDTRGCIRSSSPFYYGDEWVTFEGIVTKEGPIKHLINGEVVFEYDELQVDPNDKWGRQWLDNGGPLKLTAGHIALQAETHPTQFRFIGIKPLD